jgi:hypothetical protein
MGALWLLDWTALHTHGIMLQLVLPVISSTTRSACWMWLISSVTATSLCACGIPARPQDKHCRGGGMCCMPAAPAAAHLEGGGHLGVEHVLDNLPGAFLDGGQRFHDLGHAEPQLSIRADSITTQCCC